MWIHVHVPLNTRLHFLQTCITSFSSNYCTPNPTTPQLWSVTTNLMGEIFLYILEGKVTLLTHMYVFIFFKFWLCKISLWKFKNEPYHKKGTIYWSFKCASTAFQQYQIPGSLSEASSSSYTLWANIAKALARNLWRFFENHFLETHFSRMLILSNDHFAEWHFHQMTIPPNFVEKW